MGIRPIESMASLDGDVTSSAGTSAALLRREKREEAERDPLWGFLRFGGIWGGFQPLPPPLFYCCGLTAPRRGFCIGSPQL